MRFDITRLPVAEGIVVFLLAALGVTFALAFNETGDGGDGGPSVSESPAPGSETPAPGSETPAPTGGGNEFVVTMGDNFFDPKEFTVSAGATVKFNITNGGSAIHNMRIAGEDNEYNSGDDAVSDPELMTGGTTGTLEWTAPGSPGVINFQCDFHPTDMKGTITVE